MDPNNPNPIAPDDLTTKARAVVLEYVNSRIHRSDGDKLIGLEDVYIVSFKFIMGYWKALVSTTIPDLMYYEVTHDRSADAIYIDAYRKIDSVTILPEEV